MDSKERIRNLMKERNLTEYRLAKLSGLSQSTISNIFVRNTAPTVPTVEAICAGLGITLSQFFSESNIEKAVYLSQEQVELFNNWLSLTVEQKKVVKDIIHLFKEQNHN